MNGFPCNDRSSATVEDFIYSENILKRRPPTTAIGTTVTEVTVNQYPALNTQGLSMERIDYDAYGINPPHIHPRASELLTVLNGTIYAGFVTSPPESRLFAKILCAGEVILFPYAQIHFQINVGNDIASAISSLSSQFPGVVRVADTVFGSNPPILKALLARSFRLRKNTIARLQKSFS